MANTHRPSSHVCWQSDHSEFKIAGRKPEVVITQLADNIETGFPNGNRGFLPRRTHSDHHSSWILKWTLIPFNLVFVVLFGVIVCQQRRLSNVCQRIHYLVSFFFYSSPSDSAAQFSLRPPHPGSRNFFVDDPCDRTKENVTFTQVRSGDPP